MADQTLGQVIDFLGAKMPSMMEPGDVITDVVVVVAYQGDRGQDLAVVYPEGTSWIMAEGMLKVANGQGAMVVDVEIPED